MVVNIKAIYRNILFGNKLIAIEHCAFGEQTTVAGIIASLKDENIQVVNSFLVDSISKTTEFIAKNSPVSLVITSSNVLTKQVPSANAQEALATAFPNLNLTEFYYEVFPAQESFFVSVCRKDYLDKLFIDYEKAGLYITNFSIGNRLLQSLTEYIPTTKAYTLSSLVTLSKEHIISIEKKEADIFEEYSFEDQIINSNHLLGFASIVDSIANTATVESNTFPSTESLLTKFKEIRFFKLMLYGGITLLLGSLLINFFIFSSRYKQFQQLNEDKELYQTQGKQLEKRIEIIKRKEVIVKSIQKTGFSKSSFYTDQIIQRIPEYISLNALTFQPLVKNIRKGKPIQYSEEYMSIKGSANNKLALNNWINSIQLLDFVNNVTIMHYGNEKGNLADFEIAINLVLDDTEN